jgi:hypothetical protein
MDGIANGVWIPFLGHLGILLLQALALMTASIKVFERKGVRG